jgi:hypothetical protein
MTHCRTSTALMANAQAHPLECAVDAALALDPAVHKLSAPAERARQVVACRGREEGQRM